MLARLILIPILIIAQIGTAAYGRSVFVWCLGPHGELKLELPHESCHHDCGEVTPASTPQIADDHHEAFVHTHGCDDVPADLTVPAVRRADRGALIAAASDLSPPVIAGFAGPNGGPDSGPPPRCLLAPTTVDLPAPALRELRTVRMLV